MSAMTYAFSAKTWTDQHRQFERVEHGVPETQLDARYKYSSSLTDQRSTKKSCPKSQRRDSRHAGTKRSPTKSVGLSDIMLFQFANVLDKMADSKTAYEKRLGATLDGPMFAVRSRN